MSRVAALAIDVSYSQICIFDSSLQSPFNEWTDGHVAQGFSWRLGSVSFRTIEEDGLHNSYVEIVDYLNDDFHHFSRVIDVPFKSSENKNINIGSISQLFSIIIPTGLYQLRFECCNRSNNNIAFPIIKISFAKSENPSFAIVQPGPDLKPSKPLIITAEPA